MENSKRLRLAVSLGLVFAAFLWPNATSAQDAWVTNQTWFDPDTHGWPFVNDARKVCAAPTCQIENRVIRNAVTFRWALCGGMSLSALQRFREGRSVEDFSPTVKEELVRAQLETVAGTWAKFIEWQAKPDLPHPPLGPHTIGYSSKGEWRKVRDAIDRGAPIILGLIREGPTSDPTRAGNNHQVLAVGYRYNDGTQDMEVLVYDPNHPHMLPKITMNFGLPDNRINASQSTGERVRGFFVIEDGSGPPIWHFPPAWLVPVRPPLH